MIFLREQFESLRYTNHLWPLLVLRLYVGYFFLKGALFKEAIGYLKEPRLSAAVDEVLLSASEAPFWIKEFYTSLVQNDWLLWSKIFVNLEWFLGFFLLIGFLNRPVGLVALLYIGLTSFISTPVEWASLSQIIVMLVVLVIFGSGRVGGIDYFFYKRKRGLVW